MTEFNVIFKLDLQCVEPCDVVPHLKETLFPNGIGKPVIVIERCLKEADGMTVSLKYHLEDVSCEAAVISICDIMDFNELGNETVFTVVDLKNSQTVFVKAFQDGTVKIAA